MSTPVRSAEIPIRSLQDGKMEIALAVGKGKVTSIGKCSASRGGQIAIKHLKTYT